MLTDILTRVFILLLVSPAVLVAWKNSKASHNLWNTIVEVAQGIN